MNILFNKIKFWKYNPNSSYPFWWRTQGQLVSPRAKQVGLDKLSQLIRIYRRKKKIL